MSKSVLRLATGVVGLAVAAMLVLGLASPNSAFASSRPVVLHLSPAAGPSIGGTTVTIRGHGFVKVTKVKFGTRVATHVKVRSHTRITARVPAGSGTVHVRVTTRAGVSSTPSASKYTYYARATVASVSPAIGSASGSTSVSISGAHFSGVTAVEFGTITATSFTVNSDTSITAVSPAGSGSVDVRVANPGGASATSAADRYTYTLSVTVTGVSPAAGPALGGTLVTITGINLGGATAVKFGDTAATLFTVSSSTSIRAVAPAGAVGTVDVTVTTPAGTSATSAADLYAYSARATITSVSPAAGPTTGGTLVIVTGANLSGATAVKFGATAATLFAVSSTTSITAVAPAGAAGAVNVTVTTSAGTSVTSAADRYTYVLAPVIKSVKPASGAKAGGTAVTITGANLGNATAVTFGGSAAAITKNTGASITVTTPRHAAGKVGVTVTTSGGTTTATGAYTYS